MGGIEAGRVLAEGFKDLTCESSSPLQVQVKSLQERGGDFRVAEVARFVVQAWQQRLLRVPAYTAESAWWLSNVPPTVSVRGESPEPLDGLL